MDIEALERLSVALQRISAALIDSSEAVRDLIADAREQVEERSTPEAKWDGFLAAHPELKFHRLQFNDDDVFAALVEVERQAAENDAAQHRPPWRRGWLSSHVAAVLAGGDPFFYGRDRVTVIRPDVVRVGQALARLARAGRVRVTSRSWETTKRWAVVRDAA
jgi:hypothetical protein